MDREYQSGKSSGAIFFVGTEVEKTPAYGLKTLFIVGYQSIEDIKSAIKEANEISSDTITHLFFGANHSFDPKNSLELSRWEVLIQEFLNQDYQCSLDIPLSVVEQFNDGILCEYSNFIPQIRIPIPFIQNWNYNTMVKLDDIAFKATNPGIWTHSLHTLTKRSAFTDWKSYKKDIIIK